MRANTLSVSLTFSISFFLYAFSFADFPPRRGVGCESREKEEAQRGKSAAILACVCEGTALWKSLLCG